MQLPSSLMEFTSPAGQEQVKVPTLQLEMEPRHREFLRNLRELIWPKRLPSLNLSSRPGEFWPDVFVRSYIPWGKVAQSGAGHVFAIACMLLWFQFWPKPNVVKPAVFHKEDVIYYTPSEYLAPLDTGGQKVQAARKGDPELARQPIVSVPPDGDNRRQTIVTPPNLKLNHDVAMPNIVAWSPIQPEMPLAATENLHSRVSMPAMNSEVVAPAPQVSALGMRTSDMQQRVVAPAPEITAQDDLRGLPLPRTKVIAPPPDIRADMSRRVGDVNIPQQKVVAPAPQLTVAAERARRTGDDRIGRAQVVPPAPELRAGASRARHGVEMGKTRVVGPAPNVTQMAALREEDLGNRKIVPPPPSAQGLSEKSGHGRIIALNARPMAVAPPAEPPAGNRRGRFAATPEGKPGAEGRPETRSANKSGQGEAVTNSKGLPPGLHVGVPESEHIAAASIHGNGEKGTGGESAGNKGTLMASVTPPRVTGRHELAREVPEDNASPEEQRVFGGRPFYSMALNLPNLNSAGGSWVMHFAELDESTKGVLMAPEAVREVDPAYPLELMRHNVHGTVTLYAVIRSDGTVGDVRVLDGVDDQLDRYACDALEKWKFLPATKNGNTVPLAVVVKIPFRPVRSAF